MRRAIWLSLLLAAPVTLNAQATGAVIGGLSVSKWAEHLSDVTTSVDTKLGFAVGLELVTPLRHDLAFMPEFLYVQKGASDQDGGTSVTVRLSYLEVPLLFRLNAGHGKTRPFFFAGPFLAAKIGCSISASNSLGESGSADCQDNPDFSIKSTDFGISFGAGIQGRGIAFSARYDYGMANLAVEAPAGQSVNNRSFLFLAHVTVK